MSFLLNDSKIDPQSTNPLPTSRMNTQPTAVSAVRALPTKLPVKFAGKDIPNSAQRDPKFESFDNRYTDSRSKLSAQLEYSKHLQEPPTSASSVLPTPAANDAFGFNIDSSDEENVHSSVLSRHYQKKRKTSTSSVTSGQHFSSSGYAFPTPPNQHSFDSLSAPPPPNPTNRRRKSNSSVPACDLAARTRCFEYIHSAIDAVWVEFCISTSCAEDLRYMPQSPISDSEPAKLVGNNRLSKRSDSVSSEPKSQTLMKQKQRLQNAKSTLSQYVSNQDLHSSQIFWRIWDQLKYLAVEAVEGDDDEFDDVIDELEHGRLA